MTKPSEQEPTPPRAVDVVGWPAVERLAAAGLVVVPAEPSEAVRRAIWLAQYRHTNEAKGHDISEAGLAELAERRVADPEQRALDCVAWRAMVDAAHAD
jgi:hypothetical protein